MSKRKFTRRQFLAGAGITGATAVVTGNMLAHTRTKPRLSFLPRVLRSFTQGVPNIITVMSDTLRYDHIGFHGNSWIQTPNIDAFAGQSQVFDHAYAGGFPTVLNRAELFTGRYVFPIMNWEDLPTDAIVMATQMNDAGYASGMVFDNGHLKDDGFFLDRGFQSWEWIRGQEGDRYRVTPRNITLPADASKLRDPHKLEQHLRNALEQQTEADSIVACTMQGAVDWLLRNKDEGPLYLHIDAFDPHEPWNPPQAYIDLYNPEYSGQQIMYPAYAPPDYMTDAELNHMKALYAAEITLVDTWFGYFLNELDAMGLADNTIVIFMSDHGFLLGEHNAVGKAWSHNGYYEAYPLYQELVHVPLMIRMPGVNGKRINALVQPADIMPTVLDYGNADDPGTMHGMSLRPFIEDPSATGRPIAVSGRSMKKSLASKNRLTVTDGEWTLFHGGAHTDSQLYHTAVDPAQENNLINSECEMARALHAQLITFLTDIDTPEDKLDDWRPTPC